MGGGGPLARHFLGEFAERSRPDVSGFTTEALCALEAYHWPGNVRELHNVVERAVALCPGPEVTLADLPEAARSGGGCSAPAPPAEAAGGLWVEGPTLSQSKEEAEVRRILEALHKHHNNRLRAATELGISRGGLYAKLRKYGLIHTP